MTAEDNVAVECRCTSEHRPARLDVRSLEKTIAVVHRNREASRERRHRLEASTGRTRFDRTHGSVAEQLGDRLGLAVTEIVETPLVVVGIGAVSRAGGRVPYQVNRHSTML